MCSRDLKMGGKFVMEASSAMGAQSPSHEADLRPYMSEDSLVGLVVCLSALISILSFVSAFMRLHTWRSHEEHVSTMRKNVGGLKKVSIQALSTVIVYSKGGSKLNAVECPICLADYMDGESIRVLPSCKHSFHMECVDRWLLSNFSCPTCRHCLLDTVLNIMPFVEQVHVPTSSTEEEERLCIVCV